MNGLFVVALEGTYKAMWIMWWVGLAVVGVVLLVGACDSFLDWLRRRRGDGPKSWRLEEGPIQRRLLRRIKPINRAWYEGRAADPRRLDRDLDS